MVKHVTNTELPKDGFLQRQWQMRGKVFIQAVVVNYSMMRLFVM